MQFLIRNNRLIDNFIDKPDLAKMDFTKTVYQREGGIPYSLAVLLGAWQPELVKRVRSVVGRGKGATAILIVTTQGFKHTKNYRQLISYAGLSPKEYSSDSSVPSMQKNKGACKELFDRLVARGKNKKLAIIAVANKLLKQVFEVVKNGCLFDRNYYKKVA